MLKSLESRSLGKIEVSQLSSQDSKTVRNLSMIIQKNDHPKYKLPRKDPFIDSSKDRNKIQSLLSPKSENPISLSSKKLIISNICEQGGFPTQQATKKTDSKAQQVPWLNQSDKKTVEIKPDSKQKPVQPKTMHSPTSVFESL